MPKIKLKRGSLEQLQGAFTNADFAKIIGVDRTLMWRIKTGKADPGGQFVARVLVKFPKKKFDDLFVVEK